MDLKSYLLAMRSGWKIILGTVVVALAAASVLSWPTATTTPYVSHTKLFVAAPIGSDNLSELYQRNAIAQLRMTSYLEIAKSGSVTDEVSGSVGFSVDSGAVQAVVIESTLIMEISVTDSDPERARDIATAYGEVLSKTIEDLEHVQDASGPQLELRVIEEANLPDGSSADSTIKPILRNLMAGLILGLGLGIGISVLRQVLRQEQNDGAREERDA